MATPDDLPAPSWKRAPTAAPTPAPAPPGALPAPSWRAKSTTAETRRPDVQRKLAEIKEEEARGKGAESEDALRGAIRYEVEQELPVMTSDEAKREETERRLQARMREVAPPLYMGGFDPVEYGAAVPLARPQEVPPVSTPGFAEAMKPQTRVGAAPKERIDREITAGLFDDAAFNKAIAALPDDEKRDNLDAYEAYKAAFHKLRGMNPKETGVTNEDIKRDLDRQIAALSSGDLKQYVDDPANRMGYTGDPLSRALQRQVETGTIPMLEPGQLEFVQTLDRVKRGRAVGKAVSDTEKELRTRGIEITKTVKRPTGDTGPGGRPMMEDVQVGTGTFRPASEAEIRSAVERARTAEQTANALPFYMTDKRDQVLSNIEGSAKGGVLFQKEYPTGATVESPSSWFIRAALTVPNALTGAVSEVFTPPEIDVRERAARPELYKNASASVYNIANSRGLMGEIGDLYDYNPDPDMKQYAWMGKAAGFAGDIIGLDLGLIGGVATGGRTAVASARAAKAAGEAERIAPALRRGFAAGSKEFLSTIGLEKGSKFWPGADKIRLGDVRLTYGTMLGDTYRAAAEYSRVFEAERALGASDDVAHAAALTEAERMAPRSKFVDDASKAGSSIFDDVKTGAYFNDAKEWQEYSRVADAADELAKGGTGAAVRAAGAQMLRPYIASAVREVPEVGAIVRSMPAPGGNLRLTDVFEEVEKLPDAVRQEFFQAVKDSAAAQTGFTAIDRATKGVDPGRFIVRLTPNTFVPSHAVDSIVGAVEQLPEYRLVQGIIGGGIDPKTGEYVISNADVIPFREMVIHEATTGTLPRSVATKILNNLNNRGVKPAELREIMYSVTDAVAEGSRQGFKVSALAPRGEKVIGARGAVPLPSTRSLDYGENVGMVNSAMRRVWNWVVESVQKPSSLRSLLSPDQMRVVEDARRAIGSIPKRLEAALPEAPGATVAEKLVNLSLRTPVGNPMYAMRNVEFWNDVAKSALFGTADRSRLEFLLGDFTYVDPYQMMTQAGRERLYDLSVAAKDAVITAKGADGVVQMIEPFIMEAREIVLGSLKPEFARKAGEVFDLAGKPQEVLLGAYARRQATDIYEDALARILDFEPDTVGGFNAIFRDQLKGILNAEGQSMANIPLSVAVAHVLTPGASPLRTLDDVLALPGIQKWIADLNRITGTAGGIGGEQLLRMFGQQFTADILPTAAVIQNRYGMTPGSRLAEDMELMASGRASVAETGSPLGVLLGGALREELGSQPKFAEFVDELGALAEEEAKGKGSAFWARRRMTDLLDAANAGFYNLVLYYNPRFHGVNVASAPFIGYSTTGRVMPLPMSGGWVYGAGESGKEALRAQTVVTDRFGVPYTVADIYDAAVKGGAFKSRQAADVDARFLGEAQRLALEAGMGRSFAKKLVNLPATFANDSDNAWRMAYVIDALEQGKTMDEALEIGRKSLYDYGAATDFERKYIARKVLFYNFWRNNVLETTKSMLVNPARFAKQLRLTQDVTKLQFGEDKWNEMRFYTPLDAGVSRAVMQFAPKANREGELLLSPQMPYYDAVYLISGLLSTPLDMVRGVPDPVTGKRDFGSSYVFGKLDPTTQAALAVPTGADFAYDIKAKKGVAPVPHLALVDTVPGLLDAYVSMFNMKARPAEPGEEGYRGQVFTMSDEDFEQYTTFMQKGMKLIGASRPFTDFGKIAATLDLLGDGGVATGTTGSTTVTPLSAVGLTTKTKAGIPIEAEAKAQELRAQKLKDDAKARAIRSGLELAPEKTQ